MCSVTPKSLHYETWWQQWDSNPCLNETGADVIQVSGQASWADPVWVETSKHMEGQHITSSSGVDLDMELGCSFAADACRQFYHGVCFITPWGTYVTITISSGWVSPALPQLTVLANNSSHRGVSSVLTCTMSVLFPFSQCQ